MGISPFLIGISWYISMFHGYITARVSSFLLGRSALGIPAFVSSCFMVISWYITVSYRNISNYQHVFIICLGKSSFLTGLSDFLTGNNHRDRPRFEATSAAARPRRGSCDLPRCSMSGIYSHIFTYICTIWGECR